VCQPTLKYSHKTADEKETSGTGHVPAGEESILQTEMTFLLCVTEAPIDVNSVLWLLYSVDVGDVCDVLEVLAASIDT
jgi:hypothetical protein